MNSLASILYSSGFAAKTTTTKKRKHLSIKPTNGHLLRSSTPKIPLTRSSVRKEMPIASSATSSDASSSETPRCSTPVFSKQRRTRPFIACELCRQRAFQSLNDQEEKKVSKAHLHHRSSLYFYQQNQSTMKTYRRRSSIAQLLVWIV